GSVQVILAEESSTGARLDVIDSGIGISPEQLQELFTPFARIEHEGIEGTGLGLVLTKILSELNGVHIDVASEHGHGTRFSLAFKRCEAPVRTWPHASSNGKDAETIL